MIFAIASAYLLACCIEHSILVPSYNHHPITVYNVIYGLISSILCCYAVMKASKTPKINPTWLLSCHFGTVGFALLAQVPWLSNISITQGWLQRLSPSAIVVVIIFIAILAYLGFRQVRETCRIHDWDIKIHAYAIFIVVYLAVFVVIEARGENFHFHVHHAIAATFLSLFFTNWKTKLDVILHGVLIGIAIQGIAFFGSEEAMLFMIQNGPISELTLFISWISIVVIFIVYNYIFREKKVDIQVIPLP